MKRIFYTLLTLFSLDVNSSLGQSCNSGGCSNLYKNYPVSPYGTSSSPFTSSSSWSTVSSLLNGGNYMYFSVVNGSTYEWSTCSDFGSAFQNWNAELTLYDGSGNKICYDNNCGRTNCPNAPYIGWTANFTGTVKMLISEASCQTNSSSPYSAMVWRMSGSCSAPNSPSSANAVSSTNSNGLKHWITQSWSGSGADGYEVESSWDNTWTNTPYDLGLTFTTNWNIDDYPNIPFYTRARAYKCSGSSRKYSSWTYSSPNPIYTACDVPAIPTANNPTINSINMTLNSETPVVNPSNTIYAIYCSTTSQYVQSNGTLSTSAFYQTKSNWGTKTISGLTSNTQYCFYAMAKNQDGDIRSNSSNYACATTTTGTTSYIVYGNVKDNNNNPLNGVQIDYGSNNTYTNSNGDYNFTVTNGWSGTITPYLNNYTFSPANLSANVSGSNVYNKNFTGTMSVNTITISGYVKDASSNGILGVQINDGTTNVTSTNNSGFYNYSANKPYSKTITPIKSGYTFSPSNKLFLNVSTNQTQDFIGTLSSSTITISGYVRDASSNGIIGVEINDGNSTVATTSSNGYYSFSASKPYNKTITPLKSGFTFTPSNKSFSSVSVDQTQNFIGNFIRQQVFWMGVYNHKHHLITQGTSNDSKNGQLKPAKICADGSSATKIQINCDDPNYDLTQLKFSIKSYSNSGNKEISGYFENLNKWPSSTYAEIIYNHPTYMDLNVTSNPDEIIISDNNGVIFSYPIEIYRAPVLMVHGIWGVETTFEMMERELIVSKLYPESNTQKNYSPLIFKLDYERTNDASFESNKDVVPEGISSLLDAIDKEKFSAGKIDIIAHSMGGLLTRYYIQGFAKKQYDNEIHKFITINTPHSGTQAANMLKERSDLCNMTRLFEKHLPGCPDAIDDLEAQSDAVKKLNPIGKLVLNNIPTYAFVTLDALMLDDDCSSLSELISLASGMRYTKLEYLNMLFVGESSDLVVPWKSQRGNISKWDLINEQCHLKSAANDGIIGKVTKLVNFPPNSMYFDVDGFKPDILTIPDKTLMKKNGENVNIDITYPKENQSFKSGEQIPIVIKGDKVITSMYLFTGNNDLDGFIQKSTRNEEIFTYSIPGKAIGKVLILVAGADEFGNIGFDYVIINVAPNSKVQKLRFYPPSHYIAKGSLTKTRVYGLFNDGIERDLSQLPELGIEIENRKIINEIDGKYLTSNDTGKTFATYYYDAQSFKIPIEVYQDTQSTLGTKERLFEKSSFSNKKSLKISPNPNTGQFTIELLTKIAEPVTIEIYNQLGQRILISNEKSTDNLFSKMIDLDKTATGIYYVKATTKSENYSGKLVITK